LVSTLSRAERGIIVAGPVSEPEKVAPAILGLGEATGFPVLADALSGARFAPKLGAQVVGGYDLFLRSETARHALAPELILRVGGSPTSSALLGFMEEQAEAHQIVVDEGHRWKDHIAVAQDYVQASPSELLPRVTGEAEWTVAPGYAALWTEAEARTRLQVRRTPPGDLLEGQILSGVVEQLPQDSSLLVASSMPVRDLDAFGFPGPETLRVFGNRGASGIDGLVSTTLGIASASGLREQGDRPGGGPVTPVVGVLGDLAFLHDQNGLLALGGMEPKPWVVFVVVNNDGGGIFHTLPVREYEPAFTRYFATPHGLGFQAVAELHGLEYFLASSEGGVRDAFSQALARGAPAILEIRTDREKTHARRRALVAAVVESVSDLADESRWIHETQDTEDELE
jgi:2-succinyl-5-enolpyruvyl-6-hydroxy-3-cyclohexene-1-carboxylate synthase